MSLSHHTPEITIPGFDILELIGEGGMAKVYKARQTRLDRIVAIKVLKFGIAAEDAEERERFKNEARAAATINHPNIVQVIDAGEVGNVPYYVMEYVPGYSVADLLDIKRVIPEEDVMSIASELANALEYCWDQHKMIHCDIKPDNIMLHTEGTVKLADLGLARVLGRAHVEIEEDMTMGTPHYMSPEQALADEELDCRADMYSLGAMLYHMLTGVTPFHSLALEEVLQKQIDGFLPDPYEVNPKISGAAVYLIEKLMAKHSSHRPQSWGEVASDIELVVAGHMISKPIRGESISTVSRHPERPMPRILPPKKERVAAPVQVEQKPKRRILISEEEKKKIVAAHQHRERDELPWAIGMLGLAALLFLLLYGYTALITSKADSGDQDLLPVQAGLPSPSASRDQPLDQIEAGSSEDLANRDAVLDEVTAKLNKRKPKRAKPAPVDPTTTVGVTEPAPSTASPAPILGQVPGAPVVADAPEVWGDPAFTKAVQQAIKLREIFIMHIMQKSPMEDLQRVEQAARQLVAEFKRLEGLAPAGVQVEPYIRDMNQLIFDCHQSMRF